MAWLDRLIDWVMSIFPRIVVLDSTTVGVAYWFGRPRELKASHIYVVLPVVCPVELRTACPQVCDCLTRCAMTRDGRSVIIGLAVQYRVDDTLRALAGLHDLDDYLSPLAQGCAQDLVWHKTLDEIRGDYEGFRADISRALRKRLRGTGIDVMDVLVMEFSECRVVRLAHSAVAPAHLLAAQGGPA